MKNMYVGVMCALLAAGCAAPVPGPEGKQGPAGAKGDKGDQGETGKQGPPGKDGTSGCVPGQQISCPCGNDMLGIQDCADDGKGYEACQCGNGGSGGAGGSGGNGGVGGGTTTQTASDCYHQCILDYPTPYAVFEVYELKACGCPTKTPCEVACPPECNLVKAGKDPMLMPDSACGICLDTEGQKGQESSCTTTAGTNCIGDDTCSPFITCILACP